MGKIGAVVAAAGRSRRMGSPKQLMAWGGRRVLTAVIEGLQAAGADPVCCVVGHQRDEVAETAGATGAEVVYNPEYASTEMLVSYQVGIRRLLEIAPQTHGALFALGDQPHIPIYVTRQVLHHAMCRPHAIVIPSFAMRRGHPICIPADAFEFLARLGPEDSLRTLMHAYRARIEYVTVDTDVILHDMDTPEEYAALYARLNPA